MLAVIDRGHGKNTSGKRSFDGSLLEWEFNNDVTNRLQKYLIEYGVDVVLTAPSDIDTPLNERVRIANATNADIFVSLHANGFGTNWNAAHGWEIYYSKGSEKGARLANCIHDASIPYLGLANRGIKTTTDFVVVRQTKAPAVLIEHGFYTNREDIKLLKSDTFREKCAIADAKGILKYFGIEWETDYKALYEKQKQAISRVVEILKEV